MRLTRPGKRNAVSDAMVAQIQSAFAHLPAELRATVLSGEGEQFCTGLDLSELQEREKRAGKVG